MTGLDDLAALPGAARRYKRARNLVAAVHAAGYALLLFLVFTTEGPNPPLWASASSGQVSMSVLVLAVIAQGATLIAWRWRVPAGRRHGFGRRAAAVCGAGMLLAVWVADTGFAAQAATSMEAGQYQPINGYAFAVVGWTAFALVVLGIIDMVVVLSVRVTEGSARARPLAPVVMAAARDGGLVLNGGQAADPLAALARQRRRVNRYIALGVVTAVAIVALAAWAAATGHWETRMTYMVPAWLGITVVGVRRMMRARSYLAAAEAQVLARGPQSPAAGARHAEYSDPLGGDDPYAAR